MNLINELEEAESISVLVILTTVHGNLNAQRAKEFFLEWIA